MLVLKNYIVWLTVQKTDTQVATNDFSHASLYKYDIWYHGALNCKNLGYFLIFQQEHISGCQMLQFISFSLC